MLDADYWPLSDGGARGGRLYLGSDARTAHTNETRLRTSLRLLYGQGRAFGSRRSDGWSRLRRAAYVAGAPAIPLVNLPRILRQATRSATAGELAAGLPSILLHTAVQGAGEAAGYLTGRAGDEEFLVAHEFSHRPDPPFLP